MEDQQQGESESFGEEVHLLDGQEAIVDMWWNPMGIQEEVPVVQGGIIPEGLLDQEAIIPEGLPDQEAIVPEGWPDQEAIIPEGLSDQDAIINEVGEVEDVNSYLLSLDGGGDDLVQWNFGRIFDDVPNESRQGISELHLFQVNPIPPPSLGLPVPQGMEAIQPNLFSEVVPECGPANLDIRIPVVGNESISYEQVPLEESASEGLNLAELNMNPFVLLERLPPPTEQEVVLDTPPPQVESPLKNSPCLTLNSLNNQHVPPPLVKRPEAVRQLPPPPPLVKRPEIDNQNLPPLPSLQTLYDGTFATRSTRGSKRKNISPSLKPDSGPSTEVKERLKKNKRNNARKKQKSTTPSGWVEGDVWEYEKIIEARLLDNASQSSECRSKYIYYVKWRGWSSDYNSWLREEDFVDPWPLSQYWKSTLDDCKRLNQRIDKIPTATSPRHNYFLF